jgi:cytochrome c oxidase subunit 1
VEDQQLNHRAATGTSARGWAGPLARCFSTDHKVVAKQFLFAGLSFFGIGGLLAMIMRWQLAYPGQPVPVIGRFIFSASGGAVTPTAYGVLFTMHGLIMILFAITPVLMGGIGYFCVPLMIGARNMAFPRLSVAAVWSLMTSQALLLASVLAPLGSASSGWTMYPPLSTNVGSPGAGQTWVLVALLVNGLSTVASAVNVTTTVARGRAPGMTWMRLPLTIWGFWLASVLSALFVPVLACAALLLLSDRVLGTQIFVAGAAAGANAGDPMLYQHLFWIFGHPEVYILILPVWGIVGDLLSFFARKPAHGYRASVGAMLAVTTLSGVVYGHHMYATGISPLLGRAFVLLTLLISLPAMVLVLNWLVTIWGAEVRLTVPMLFALGTVFVFAAGGMTGVYLADISLDLYLHDTMFVVGHFHLTMAAATVLGAFAGIYHWFPKMFGREMIPWMGRVHFAGSLALLTLTFAGQLAAGYAGQPRRLFDPYQYEFLVHLRTLNRGTSHAAFLLGVTQLVFAVNFFVSLWRGKRASPNPWELGTLEWSVPSPPLAHNFDVLPVVSRGPHVFSRADAGARDWTGQADA